MLIFLINKDQINYKFLKRYLKIHKKFIIRLDQNINHISINKMTLFLIRNLCNKLNKFLKEKIVEVQTDLFKIIRVFSKIFK